MIWVQRVTNIAMQMVVPAIIGYGLDTWWKTTPAFTIAGVVFGFVAGLMQLLQLAKQQAPPAKPSNKTEAKDKPQRDD
jgi:F0F1-type ATP synthase assembly protein I